MNRHWVIGYALWLSTAANSAATAQVPLKMADLHGCTLTSGARIDNCRIDYRTFGQRDRLDTNAVLVGTWFSGKSADWAELLGPKHIIDTTRYYVIVVDALANGVSSSPSTAPGTFPPFTIEDMVEVQYRLAREVLGLHHLRAVVGFSMGGIQAFEWAVSHPAFVDRFISIEGSPRLARHDRAWLTAVVRTIEAGNRYRIPTDTVWYMLAGVLALIDGVQEVVNQTPSAQADSLLAQSAAFLSSTSSLNDWAAQARALLAYDFGTRPGSDSAMVVARLRNRFLIITSPEDRVVSAEPPLSLARRIGLDTLVIHSSCGHWVFGCEATSIADAVKAVLQR